MSAFANMKMPTISNIRDEGSELKFTMSNVDVSTANALRRVIIANVKSVVFRTEPHAENRLDIHTNTSRMHNEIIKQRMSCVPIHITDDDFPIDDHVVTLNMKNDGDHTIYATTGDLMIKNIKSEFIL